MFLGWGLLSVAGATGEMFSVLLQCADLATWIVTVNIGRLAEELSPKDAEGNVVNEAQVEPSRLLPLTEVVFVASICFKCTSIPLIGGIHVYLTKFSN